MEGLTLAEQRVLVSIVGYLLAAERDRDRNMGTREDRLAMASMASSLDDMNKRFRAEYKASL